MWVKKYFMWLENWLRYGRFSMKEIFSNFSKTGAKYRKLYIEECTTYTNMPKFACLLNKSHKDPNSNFSQKLLCPCFLF